MLETQSNNNVGKKETFPVNSVKIECSLFPQNNAFKIFIMQYMLIKENMVNTEK